MRRRIKGRVRQSLTIDLKVTNLGDATWLADGEDGIGVVYLGAHRSGGDDNLVDRDIGRVKIPHTVRPGEVVGMTLTINSLDRGVYRLDLDLVSEKVAWFEAAGDLRHRTVSISVEID